MILKSSTRGNGVGFAKYLQHPKNEQAYVFDIRGTSFPDSLENSLAEMSAMERLTRSNKGILQVIASPAKHESLTMTKEAWETVLDEIDAATQWQGQPRIAVIHKYEGAYHMHVGYGRYDPFSETMLPTSHIGYKLKEAVLGIETKLGHEHLLSWKEKKDLEKQQAQHAKSDEFSLNSSDIQSTTEMTPEEQELRDKQAIERARLIRRFTNKIVEQKELASLDGDLFSAQPAVQRQLGRAIGAQQEALTRELDEMDRRHANDLEKIAPELPKTERRVPEKLLADEEYAVGRQHRINKIMTNAWEKAPEKLVKEKAIGQTEAQVNAEERAAIAQVHVEREHDYHFPAPGPNYFHDLDQQATLQSEFEKRDHKNAKIEQDRQKRIDKIMENARKNKQQIIPNPVDDASERYEKMRQKIKDRNRGHEL